MPTPMPTPQPSPPIATAARPDRRPSHLCLCQRRSRRRYRRRGPRRTSAAPTIYDPCAATCSPARAGARRQGQGGKGGKLNGFNVTAAAFTGYDQALFDGYRRAERRMLGGLRPGRVRGLRRLHLVRANGRAVDEAYAGSDRHADAAPDIFAYDLADARPKLSRPDRDGYLLRH